MARIHVHTHGKSHSTRPTSKGAALWLSQNRDQISGLVVELAKEGLSPSEIGLRLRDVHGIPLVKPVLGKSVTSILTENNIKSEDRKSTRLNSSHANISYAVFCLKKKSND